MQSFALALKPVIVAFLIITYMFPPMLQLTATAQSQSIIVASPVVKTGDGENELIQARVLSQIILSVTIVNASTEPLPFVIFVEVRDSETRTTSYLQYQEGILPAGADTEVGISWLPESSGSFQIRSFIISDFTSPAVLSPVVQSEIDVGFTEIMAEPEPPAIQEPPVEGRENLGKLSIDELKRYALDLINSDRTKNGLNPVALSSNIAAQEHADDLYSSRENSTHWTPDGMKPYMRYTMFGGQGAVSQNVHAGAIYPEEIVLLCKAGLVQCFRIDMTEMLELSQYSMMYDDEECCDNGHRDNILDPAHTHVSIGLVYDDYYFAYVQNFEDIYLEFDPPINVNKGYVKMSGKSSGGEPYVISVRYDEYPTPSIYQRDKDLNSYGYGARIASIVEPAPRGYEYTQPKNYTLIEAARWVVDDESFEIEFNLNQLMNKHGRGVYTLLTYLENDAGDTVMGTTYSIFNES